MARIPSTVPTETFHAPHWDPGESVELRTYIGSYDRQRIKDAAMGVRTSAGHASSVEMRVHEAALIKLEVGIASWNWKDDNGQAIPLTRENLKLLSDEDADAILDKLNELWDTWGETAPVGPEQSAKDKEAAEAHEAAFPQTLEPRAVRRAKARTRHAS